MAVTTEGINRAEITQCVEIEKGNRRALGWSFVKFADVSEGDRYVMPAGCALHLLAQQHWLVTEEVMPNAPFPLEVGYGPTPNTGDLRIPGPRAVHYFGAGV